MITPGMDEEKRQRIIEAGIEEFGKGYALASTNEIVRKAGVSKGLLFHYFGSKKNLFLEVFKEATVKLQERLLSSHEADQENMAGDIFHLLTRLALIKLRLFQDEPALYQFLATAIQDSPDEIRQELQVFIDSAAEYGIGRLLDGIELSDLRPDVDPVKAIKLIQLVMDGFQQDYLRRKDLASLDWDKEVAEFTEYMDILRKGLGRGQSEPT
ncbi:MAG: TetR/AcrR family transcriptional regulator [Firmicutes bacterium]|nr:TetR/AcrR family transcriptional regulator [Bacillota bacterium]